MKQQEVLFRGQRLKAVFWAVMRNLNGKKGTERKEKKYVSVFFFVGMDSNLRNCKIFFF